MPTVTQEDSKDHQPDQQPGNNRDEQPRANQQANPANGGEQKDGGQNGGNQKENKQEEKKEERKPVSRATKRKRIIIGAMVGTVVLIAVVAWWLYSRTYESTDDAQIDGHLNALASRVNGTVTGVYAENDQPVKAGQALVDLDPRDYEVQVAQARASYEQALAQESAQNPNVPITQTSNQGTVAIDKADVADAEAAVASAQKDYDSNLAKLRQAEANNRKAQSDLVRYKQLVDRDEISHSEYDQYVANAASDEALVQASKASAEASAKGVDSKRAELRQRQAKLAQDEANSPRQIMIQRANLTSRKADADSAKAQLDAALLNLSYCHIVSPVDGIASQRSAEVGDRISQGQQLMVIVQTNNVWVTANFKETQLKKMRVGQRVTFKVDALDESFEGKVQDMPAATGDRSSLFPPENATGNYVKIVQRLPVRISINPKQRDFDRLRPGMSVEPTVHF